MEGWRTQVASDVIRDGLGVELLNLHNEVVAEVFRCDADHSVTVITYGPTVPTDVLAWLCEVALERFGPSFQDGSPLPERESWGRLRPNQRMKLSWCGGRLKGKGSILIAAASPRSLCAIR